MIQTGYVQGTVPLTATTGVYTLKVGIFSNNWSILYAWNNGVAQFRVK